MTTLLDLRTLVQTELRDTAAATFSVDEIDYLIGQGIDQLSSFYPKEIVGEVTIVASTYTYAMPDGLSWPFRVVLYNTDGSVGREVKPATSGHPDSGWDCFGGTLYIPPDISWTEGTTLQVWGYGPWTYIDAGSASTAASDLDQSAIWALVEFALSKAFERLVIDRGKFAQWTQTPGNTDVSALSLQSIASEHRRAWEAEKKRLARMPRRT